MKNFDYSSSFDSKAWTFNSGDFPTLKEHIDIDFVNGLEINNKESELYKGDVLEIDVSIHPNSLYDNYINEVKYSIVPETGSGIVQNGNKFSTNNALVDEFTVLAVLETNTKTYSVAKTFKVYEQIESISLVDDFPTYVEPGKQYEFNVNITPSAAPQDMKWELLDGKDDSNRTTKPSRFAFFTNNILTIKEEMMNFRPRDSVRSFTVQGTAKNGATVTKELVLKKINYLSDTYSVTQDGDQITQRVLTYYKDSEDTHIKFTLPGNADVASMTVYRFSNKINDYTRTGRTVKIPMSYIKDIPNRQLTFTFRCGTGDSQVIYRGYACYIDHNRYTLNDVSGSYIALSSAEDFYNNFRMKLDDTNESKYDNYNKTFVLTNDIDFNNADELVSIGYYNVGQNALHAFEGTIYGFGHTIKNASFKWSERIYFEGASPSGTRADPNTYRVGFFGYFQGKIYDVVFENITAVSYNYGGCFAGEIKTGGYLEDVAFINCKTYSANEVDYTIDDVVQGRIAAVSAGTFVGVTYNGTAVGLVGR